MNNKKKKIIILCGLLIIILSLVFIFILKEDEKVTSVTSIDDIVDLDNGDEDIIWDSLDSYQLSLNNKTVTINDSGVYTLSGSISNGSLIVKTKGDVKLIFNNISINNESGPAVIIEEANNTVIELADDSINKLSDGNSYENSEYDGCIYSKDDLIFQGNGTLDVISNYLDGIVSNDDLKIVSGTYIIDSKDDSIRGKDSVYIISGDFTINSDADGIKATNDTDTSKGYINIDGGNFEINSQEDGIQAETKLIINDGTFNIKTASGSGSSASAIDRYFYGGGSYDDTSSKALKAGDNLVIKGGSFIINSKDDAIHSNNYIGISLGSINISSGDDGIHADKDIIIDDGKVEIKKSYEGIEASNITINNGDISIVAADDGINISGGNDGSSVGNRPGANNFSSSNGKLIINGGKIYVNASGDGLDANGSIEVNAGNVSVEGPTDNGNGPLDYDREFLINGGSFVAMGSSGMAQNASDNSKQYSVMFYLNNTYDGGLITLEDNDGNVIFEYEASKKIQCILISTSKIIEGNSYIMKVNDEEIDKIMVSDIINSNSGFGIGMNGGGPGAPNDNRGHPGRR